MRWRGLAIIVVLYQLLGAGAFAEDGTTTIWNLNGSQMELVANGSQREFRYKAVRPGLSEVGIHPGTVIFQGSRIGSEYSGTAFVYSKACGGLPYPVSGPISDDERTVTLYGKAPNLLTEDCEVAGSRDDVAVFQLLADSGADAQTVGEEKDYGNDGQLFSSGKEDYYLLSRTPHASELSTAYVGEVRVVHNFDGGGYEILMKAYSVRCQAADRELLVIWQRAGDDSAPVTVRIDHPDRPPKADEKESYNLYWAACFEKFRRFK